MLLGERPCARLAEGAPGRDPLLENADGGIAQQLRVLLGQPTGGGPGVGAEEVPQQAGEVSNLLRMVWSASGCGLPARLAVGSLRREGCLDTDLLAAPQHPQMQFHIACLGIVAKAAGGGSPLLEILQDRL